MAENKTKAGAGDVGAFLDSVSPEQRRADSLALDRMFREVSGYEPVMWGASMVGYGRYHYRYESGREGDSLATGFSPRKGNLVLYIMPGYTDFGEILVRLGKHKLGKSCLYLNKLADVDMDVLRELVRAGLDDLNGYWPVKPV